MKLQKAVDLIRNNLKGAKIEIVKHYVIERSNSEYFRLKVRSDDILLDIRERWVEGRRQLYGYQLRIGDKNVLRYDNAPHHREISTFPHHKHIEGRVEELKNPDLTAFLDDVKLYLRLLRDKSPTEE